MGEREREREREREGEREREEGELPLTERYIGERGRQSKKEEDGGI